MGRKAATLSIIFTGLLAAFLIGWNLPVHKAEATATETITSADITTVDTNALIDAILKVGIKPCPDAADFQDMSTLMAQAYLVAEADPKPLQFAGVAAQTQISQWVVCHSQVAEEPAVPRRVRK